MRAAERRRVPDDQRADAVWEKETLVRIEHDRVGALDPAERAPPGLRQQEKPAVRRVDVQTEALSRGELRQRLEIVDRARVRRARARDDEEG